MKETIAWCRTHQRRARTCFIVDGAKGCSFAVLLRQKVGAVYWMAWACEGCGSALTRWVEYDPVKIRTDLLSNEIGAYCGDCVPMRWWKGNA